MTIKNIFGQNINYIYCGNKIKLFYLQLLISGRTSLYTGERREKTDLVFEALGATDELSSTLGIAREYAILNNNEKIISISKNIFTYLTRRNRVSSLNAAPLYDHFSPFLNY